MKALSGESGNMVASEAVTIYALLDEGGAVYYVGQTRRVEQRRREHRKSRPHLTLIALAQVAEGLADEAEQQWIGHYRSQGIELLNATAFVPRGKRRQRESHENWIAVRIPTETKEWLEAWAGRKDTSMSWIVRRLLVEAQQSGRDQKDGL